MLTTDIYRAIQGVACFCSEQKYLSNIKITSFWNMMQNLVDDAIVLEKKMLRT
jgi:hypothetical protein